MRLSPYNYMETSRFFSVIYFCFHAVFHADKACKNAAYSVSFLRGLFFSLRIEKETACEAVFLNKRVCARLCRDSHA